MGRRTVRIAALAVLVTAGLAASSQPLLARTGVAPKNTLRPALSGTPVDGGTLQTSNGNWSGTQPITYSYQWKRCNATGSKCASVTGATAQSYAPTAGDLGSTLYAIVTARNPGGKGSARSDLKAVAASASVPPTEIVVTVPPTETSPPALSGTATSGQTLSASTGGWTGTSPLVYSYQWKRCDTAGNGCASIAGATGISYRASADDVGTTLRARVTAANVAGSSAAETDPSAAVTPAAAPVVNGPAIPPAPGLWTLKFADEFEGSSLDLNKWRPNWLAGSDTAITKPVNSAELSCYDPAQVSVGGGMLTLSAVERACTANNGITYKYASGLVESNSDYQFTFGYAEARMRVPVNASGTPVDWPAFWADGTGNWPTTGEIDVMEILGGGTFCWHFHFPNGAPGGCPALSDAGGWHVFGADWGPTSITFYYDGVAVGQVTSGVTTAPMFLIANLGISTQHGGPLSVPAKTDFDYVRVWQHF